MFNIALTSPCSSGDEDEPMTMSTKVARWCAVCGAERENKNYGAKVCRACALFYKRCVLERKAYPCVDGHYNCNVSQNHYDRIRCKACRFLGCKQAGVNFQFNTPIFNSVDAYKRNNFPTILGLIDGLKKFHAIQWDTVRQRHRDEKLIDGTPLTPKTVESLRLKYETTADLMEMFSKHFGPFSDLSRNDQVKILTDVYPEFRVLTGCYLTSYYCPELDDNRLVFAPGYSVDPTRIDNTRQYTGFLDPDEVEKYNDMVRPFRHRYLERRRQFKVLNLNLLDTVVLMLLEVWKHIEFNGKLTRTMEEFKDRAMKEWMKSLKQRFDKERNDKLFQFMLFYKELDRFSIEHANLIVQIRILLSRRHRAWAPNLDEALAKLKVEE